MACFPLRRNRNSNRCFSSYVRDLRARFDFDTAPAGAGDTPIAAKGGAKFIEGYIGKGLDFDGKNESIVSFADGTVLDLKEFPEEMMRKKVECVRTTIREIGASKESPSLIRIK